MDSTYATLTRDQLIEELHAFRNRVIELENEKDETQGALQVSERRFQAISENIPDLVYSLNQTGLIKTINKAVTNYGYSKEEMIGRHFIDFIYEKDRDLVIHRFLNAIVEGHNLTRTLRFRILTKSGRICWLEANIHVGFTSKGQFVMHEGVCRDITESINIQKMLLKSQEQLEDQVKIRTSELTSINLKLQKEITERRETEKALREREKDLELEKANLQEINTALKVMLKRREIDKQELQEQMMYNIKTMVAPYVEKLNKTDLNERQQAYMQIIETNLSDIISPFARRLSLEFHGLTRSELKIAYFIRQGSTTKQIATMLGLSSRTVEAYRLNIRRKLNLKNKNINLRTFLLTIN